MSADSTWDRAFERVKLSKKDTQSATENAQHLIALFVTNLERAMNEELDGTFWEVLKTMIGKCEEASVKENAVNLSVCLLTDLCLAVERSYKLPQVSWLSSLSLSATLVSANAVDVERSTGDAFCAFVSLRMGDLMRYKKEMGVAKNLYMDANRMNPFNGAPMNQLGLIANENAQWVEALYSHCRALYSSVPFESASANIVRLFQKFANKDVTKPIPSGDLYVSILAKIHFLMEIPGGDATLHKVGDVITTAQHIVPLLAVYSSLVESDAADEIRSICAVEKIWRRAFRNFVDICEHEPTPKNLVCLSLLLRNPRFCEPAPKLRMILDMKRAKRFSDHFHFNYFRCLTAHMVKYPLSHGVIGYQLLKLEWEPSQPNTEMKLIARGSPTQWASYSIPVAGSVKSTSVVVGGISEEPSSASGKFSFSQEILLEKYGLKRAQHCLRKLRTLLVANAPMKGNQLTLKNCDQRDDARRDGRFSVLQTPSEPHETVTDVVLEDS